MLTSVAMIGDFAEISKDRRYESNDSREMENASISWVLSVVAVDELEGFPRRGQKPFFSGGEGGRYTPLSLTTLILYSAGSCGLLAMLMADDGFDPVVSTFSNPGVESAGASNRGISSCVSSPWLGPGRFAKGLRIGMVNKDWREMPYDALDWYFEIKVDLARAFGACMAEGRVLGNVSLKIDKQV